jgi:hypothetical protein
LALVVQDLERPLNRKEAARKQPLCVKLVFHPSDGHFINDQVLVKIMVNQSIKAVESLEKFGTVFQKEGENIS